MNNNIQLSLSSGVNKVYFSASFQTRMKLSEFVHKVTKYIFLAGGKNNIGKIWQNQQK